MESFRVWVFPVLLVLGAVALFSVELRTVQGERKSGRPRWSRFVRRLVGSLVIVAVGVMLHLGEVPTQPTNQHQVMQQFYYWMVVLGLVAISMFLAVWDVIDSLKVLKGQLETLAHDEMSSLRDQIKAHSNHKSQPM